MCLPVRHGQKNFGLSKNSWVDYPLPGNTKEKNRWEDPMTDIRGMVETDQSK